MIQNFYGNNKPYSERWRDWTTAAPTLSLSLSTFSCVLMALRRPWISLRNVFPVASNFVTPRPNCVTLRYCIVSRNVEMPSESSLNSHYRLIVFKIRPYRKVAMHNSQNHDVYWSFNIWGRKQNCLSFSPQTVKDKAAQSILSHPVK